LFSGCPLLSRLVGNDGTMMVHATSSCQSVQWLALMVQLPFIVLTIGLWLAVTAPLAGDNCLIADNDCSAAINCCLVVVPWPAIIVLWTVMTIRFLSSGRQ